MPTFTYLKIMTVDNFYFPFAKCRYPITLVGLVPVPKYGYIPRVSSYLVPIEDVIALLRTKSMLS